MSAETIARALGGYRVGCGFIARCPAHDDTTPSLSLTDALDAKLLVHCFAGCSQAAVIAALRDRSLWPGNLQFGITQLQTGSRRQVMPASKDDRERTVSALKLWSEARPAGGTLVETYLRSRGIRAPKLPRIKFHPQLKHYPSGTSWPAMLALVTRGSDDRPVAVHRTWLQHDGSCKAPVDPGKMMLGPCRGGAVALAPAANPLMIGEGIETCLSAMQATGHAAWAALSASGLKTLSLPPEFRDVIVLADGDDPGKVAAEAAAKRWHRQGRGVRIAAAPTNHDFNDLLGVPLEVGP
jgi:hypothetical protein